MGLDTDKFIEGARACVEDVLRVESVLDSDAAKYAILDMLLAKDDKFAARYMLPYGEELASLPALTAQLAGESNNKDGIDSLNQISGTGPIALHSDVESWARKEKRRLLIEEIFVKDNPEDLVHGDTGLKSLGGYRLRSMHQDMLTQLALPTGKHIRENVGNPVISTVIDKLDEFNIAYLVMRYMLSTVVQAGIQDGEGTVASKIDKAIRQPQVEQMKKSRAKTLEELSKIEL